MQRNRTSTLAIMLTAVTLCWSQTANAQKLLRWKLRPGENIQVNFQQDMKMGTVMMDTTVETAVTMGMTLGWQIDQVSPDGVAGITQSVERLHMKLDNPGSGTVEYDSASQAPPEGLAKTLASGISPIIGVEFIQQMDARGEILSVELTEAAKQKLATAPAAVQVRQLLSKDGLRSLLHQASAVLPADPIAPGESWTSQLETKSPVGTLVMDMTYTYRGTEVHNNRQLERIDVDVKVGFGKEPNALGLQVAVSDQKNQGALFFDAEAGRFVSTQLNQEMTLETKVGEKTHRQELQTILKMQFTSRQSTQANPAARMAAQPAATATP